jgi:hypothetical protein
MLIHNNIGGNVGIGINATGTNDGIKIFGNSIWYNQKGVMLVNTQKFKMDENEFDSNLVADIHIKNSHHSNISDSLFYGCSQASDSSYPSIILETDTSVGYVNTQQIKISNNTWFKEPHYITDITGAVISAGNNKAQYCIKEINTGGSADTNFNTFNNDEFIEYAAAPCLIIGDGTRRELCYPETQNIGVNQSVGSGNTSVVQNLFEAEPDTNYIVTVIPKWNTTYWISSKGTSSFTINFGTGPTGTGYYDFYITAMP